jgi:hypothetical protein
LPTGAARPSAANHRENRFILLHALSVSVRHEFLVTKFISLCIVIYERRKLPTEVSTLINEQGRNECANIAKDVYLMLKAENAIQK